MPIPNINLQRIDGNTGVVRPGVEGILAIIAGAQSTAMQNVCATYTRPEDIVTDSGYGRLASLAAYDMSQTSNPVLGVVPSMSQAATYSAMTVVGGGTSTPTAGATAPLDDYPVIILFVAGGVVGVAGPTYQVSLDNGNTYGAVTALGTANSIAIPNTGITVALGAGTLVAGQTIAFTTQPAAITSSDLTASLNALAATAQPWDAVLVDTQFATGTATIAAQLETWLTSLETRGVFRSAVINHSMKGLAPYAAAETEAAYAARLQPIQAQITGIRVITAADGGDMVDYFQGIRARRPASIYIAARGEANDVAVDVAFEALGPLQSCFLQDARGNPKYHDENRFPTLDALGISTLRSFDGENGAFITDALIPAGVNGSDYVYWQHLRVMNKACTIAWALLRKRLSMGVNKSSKVGPNGERYIAEADAASIEQAINGQLQSQLKNEVSAVQLTLSRNDNIASNQGAIITSTLAVVALAYIKGFKVRAGFTKALSTPF